MNFFLWWTLTILNLVEIALIIQIARQMRIAQKNCDRAIKGWQECFRFFEETRHD
jgi:hypothetical protein